MLARPALFLLAGLFLSCGLFLQADAASGNLLMLQAKSMLQPLIMQMILGGTLDREVDHMLAQVPNKTCSGHIKAYIDGVKKTKLWALKMVDSSTKIPESVLTGLLFHMGDYDECINVRDVSTVSGTFSGQHCMSRLCLTEGPTCSSSFLESSENALMLLDNIMKRSSSGETKMRDLLPQLRVALNGMMLHVAICMPSTCSARDIEVFLNAAISQFTNQVHANLNDFECHTTEGKTFGYLDRITIVLLLAGVGLVAWSTWYDLQHQDPENRIQLYAAFSAYTNWKRIFDTSVDRDTLHCVHGIRFLSIVWVVLGHRFIIDAVVPVTNFLDVVQYSKSWACVLVAGALFSVDTFFTVSGLLISYVFLNLMAERPFFNLPVFYLHRYIRLTPPLAVMVLLQSSLLAKLGDGPIWNYAHDSNCDRYWWHTLLYIVNYKSPVRCVGQSWYLSADTQLYWLSPLLLIPLWKNPRRGRRLLAVTLFLSWIIPFLQAYVKKLNVPLAAIITRLVTANRNLDGLYYATECRFAPWVVGMCLGVALHRMRVQQYKIKLNKFMVTVMWLVILTIMVGSISSMHHYLQPDHVYSRFGDSLYNSVSHLLWGVAVALTIFACVTGYGGPVNWLLSLGVWQPLSRMTYAIFLVHLSVQMNMSFGVRSPQFFNPFASIPRFISDLVVSVILAIFMNLMVESPLFILEKVMYTRATKQQLSEIKSSPEDIDKPLIGSRKANGVL